MNKICKKIILLCAAVSLTTVLLGADEAVKTPQEAYIAKYAATAVREMYRSGVPASITLAQGMLESRYGLSTLAVDGNNHFGIKCHDWTGKKMYQDDDEKGECFRVYGSADESFADHSDFLRYRDRYKSLFDNEITDYKAWAYGLKKAGYATDPSYPTKLINLIENYHLYDYDRMKPEDFADAGNSAKEEKAARQADDSKSQAGKAKESKNKDGKSNVNKSRKDNASTSKSEKRSRKHNRTEKTDAGKVVEETTIPESPLSIEEPKLVTDGKADETFRFSLSRQLYSKNGVPFIYSVEGESYSSIASEYHLFAKEILRFNDVSEDRKLEPGTIVYLQSKKSQTRRGLDKYISENGGETLLELSQRFAVKLKDLSKLNGLSVDYVTRPGDEIDLRNTKK